MHFDHVIVLKHCSTELHLRMRLIYVYTVLIHGHLISLCSACLFVCLSVCLSVCLFVCLFSLKHQPTIITHNDAKMSSLCVHIPAGLIGGEKEGGVVLVGSRGVAS